MLAELGEDVLRPDHSILQVRPAFALEGERFVDVERNDFGARVFDHEIAHRRHRNHFRDTPLLAGAELGIALGHFGFRARCQRVEQIVGLHALAAASRHFDEAALVVGVAGGAITERPRGRRRQRDHLVREVRGVFGLYGVAERTKRLRQ